MIETAEVQPDPGGATTEKEAWVKGRQRKRRRGVPALHITRGRSHSTLNKEAAEILTREGELYCYAIVEEGKLRLQPIPNEPGSIEIIRLHLRGEKAAGAFLGVKPSILAAIGAKPGDSLIGQWDDAESSMTFEVERV